MGCKDAGRKIQTELGWKGDVVENVPINYNYEKSSADGGVRDYIKYIKRGYTRPTHLAAIDLRNDRISKEEAQQIIKEFEGRRPPSLDLFLEYVGLSEEEFYSIAIGHQVSPWEFDKEQVREGKKTPDFDSWIRGDGLKISDKEKQVERWSTTWGCNLEGAVDIMNRPNVLVIDGTWQHRFCYRCKRNCVSKRLTEPFH